MATTLSYHVSGPIVPWVTVGVAGAYVPVGVCEEGADIDIIPRVADVKHDGGGGANSDEVENILLNVSAVIRFRLVPFAGDYVNAMRARSQGRSAAAAGSDGEMVTPGTLFGFNSCYVGLHLPTYILTQEVDGPWLFHTCRIVRAGNNRVSTKETKLDFEFRAINFFNISSVSNIENNVLYERVSP